MKMLRIMLDTNILISASVFRSHIINQIMTYVHDYHRLVISSYVMEELYTVVKRKFPQKMQNVEEFFSDWCAIDQIYSKEELKGVEYVCIQEYKTVKIFKILYREGLSRVFIRKDLLDKYPQFHQLYN